MNKDELTALRERLLAEITPLVIENAGDGVDRFSLLLRVIQGGHATSQIYAKAFESAHSIDQSPDRLEALLALLDEVEVDLDSGNDTTDQAVEEAPQASPERQSENHDQQEHQNQQYEQHYDQ